MNTVTGLTGLLRGVRPTARLMEREAHVAERFQQAESERMRRFHWLFGWLLLAEWPVIALIAARGPHRLDGFSLPALVLCLGTLLVVPAICLMGRCPDAAVTRHAVAVAQMGFCALFIGVCDGRAQAHFLIFASLAFLALYRDWRVIATATVVTGLDHVGRGHWHPQSLYGASEPQAGLTAEHVAWIGLVAGLLVWGCVASRRELWLACERDEDNDRLLGELERRLNDRTAAVSRIEERTSSLLRNLSIGIFEAARSGEVLLANKAMLRLMGLDDTSRASLDSVRGPVASPEERARFWAILDAEGEVHGFESTLRKSDGRLITVVINARLKATHDGTPATCEGSCEDVTERKRSERELESLNAQLVTASRQIGMAEVATGVLHNVGNVLTSVNLTVHDIQDRTAQSRIVHLRKATELLRDNKDHLGEYLSEDPTGSQIPDFLMSLTGYLEAENSQMKEDMAALNRHFEHIREIIVTQQSSARVLGTMAEVRAESLVEDALRLCAESFDRHRITLRKRFAPCGPVRVDRNKVLQILINLLQNAKDALKGCERDEKTITVVIEAPSPSVIEMRVEDNGSGIAPADLARVFQHGFTTKKDGHGFGLHSASLAAREMGGELRVASEGPGRGASFCLRLPSACEPC